MAETTYFKVLRHLDRSDEESETIPEIARAVGRSVGTVRGTVKELVAARRVLPMGVAARGGRTYGISRLGREAVAAADAEVSQ